MKRSVLLVAFVLLGGLILAQQKPAEKEQTVILKSGEASVSTVVNPSLPRDCKDWNIAEIPGQPDSIFICKAGKWIEYVQKDKLVAGSIPKDQLALLCAEEDTEVPEPKPESKPPAEKK